jgi:hypothetical protein
VDQTLIVTTVVVTKTDGACVVVQKWVTLNRYHGCYMAADKNVADFHA